VGEMYVGLLARDNTTLEEPTCRCYRRARSKRMQWALPPPEVAVAFSNDETLNIEVQGPLFIAKFAFFTAAMGGHPCWTGDLTTPSFVSGRAIFSFAPGTLIFWVSRQMEGEQDGPWSSQETHDTPGRFEKWFGH